jgi:hypothetical protein
MGRLTAVVSLRYLNDPGIEQRSRCLISGTAGSPGKLDRDISASLRTGMVRHASKTLLSIALSGASRVTAFPFLPGS